MICNPVSNSENVTLRYLLYKIWTENVSLWRHENWNPPFSKWLDPRLTYIYNKYLSCSSVMLNTNKGVE